MATLRSLRRVLLQSEVAVVAGGIAIGLATYYLVQATVFGLIAPLIAVFVGNSRFELNSFTIDGTEFGYGAVIEYAITFVLVAAVILLLVWWQRRHSNADLPPATVERACPECTSPISSQARRCPFCTATVEPF